MYKPLVSLMIPYYNAERTLKRCLDSAAALSYRPLEVILVSDGGTDGSVEIARQFAEANCDSSLSIKLLNLPQNRGVAYARAVALENARGEYITAVDADDYVNTEAVDVYVNATDNGRMDIVAGGVIYEYPSRSEIHNFSADESFNLNDVTINSLYFLLTNKLIRTRLLRDVAAFTEGQNCWEDLGALSRVLARGASIRVLQTAHYHYVQSNEGSLTRSAADNILHQHIEVARDLERWMETEGVIGLYQPFLDYLKFIAKVKYLRNPRALAAHPIQRLRMWRDTFPEVNAKITSFHKVALRYRLAFKTAYLFSRMLPGDKILSN